MREFTGKSMAWVMAGFFGAFLCANLTLAFAAARTWTGLVVENSYVASQGFDARRAEIEAQRALGWRAEANWSEGALLVTFEDDEGVAIDGLEVGARIERPTHERNDLDVALAPGPAGYVAKAALAPGPWIARIEARGPAGEAWSEAVRFFVAPER